MDKSKLPKLFPYKVQDAVIPLTEIPWNILAVNAPAFWPTTKGDNIVVAVVDTGLDINHPEIAGRVIGARTFMGGDSLYNVTDESGHGMHVACTIAGKTCGVAPEARIMPLKVFGGNGGDGEQFQEAMRYILKWNRESYTADHVVRVNCSWGGTYADTVLNYLIRQLWLSGVQVVCAAGNAGDGDPTTHEVFNYPAYWWEVFTTGAVDHAEKPAGFTNSFDGVDMGAPGVGIYSAWPSNLGGGYKLLSGTSMATPHVTGAAALIAAAFKKREGRLPTYEESDKILLSHIKKVALAEEFVGRGLLDLTYKTTRWPLHRVQVGAFFNKSGQDDTYNKVTAAGFPAYKVTY